MVDLGWTGPGYDADTALRVAGATPDPELPMLTIGDLGILRRLVVSDVGVTVTITPTYSGCPAMREISVDITRRLNRAGFDQVTIKTQLAPPWTSDWITETGRRKLAEAGIAPPPQALASPALASPAGATPAGATPARASAAPRRSGPVPLTLGPPPPVTCPRCGSARTELIAQFSATACKSLHQCASCGEPFEAAKPL
jgi:ring-1,2-phenylacetyl-CoA epoxidase subunit PaaD